MIDPVTQADIHNLFMLKLKTEGKLYKKYKEVVAKLAQGGELVESFTSGGKETENTASKGDYIVQNQTAAREWYIISAEKFNARYEFIKKLKNDLAQYKPKGQVIAVKLTPKLLKSLQLHESFHFQAPWGESQVALKGDFMVTPPEFSEVYRIGKKEFKETYRKVKDASSGEEE